MSDLDRIIYLIGARASGKTTVGRLLAGSLAYGFADTDHHMLATGGLTVAEVVAREGWEGFRRREKAALREVSRPARVIATGGGIILDPENREFMRRNGLVFWLSAPAAVLAARLEADPNAPQRPSLTGTTALGEIEDILRERTPLYEEAAHHVLDAACGMNRTAEAALRLCRGSLP